MLVKWVDGLKDRAWRWRSPVLACLMGLGVLALIVAFFSPPFVSYLYWSTLDLGRPEVNRGFEVWRISQSPWIFKPVMESNFAVRFRLLFPVLKYLLWIPDQVFFLLPSVGVFACLAAACAVIRERTDSWMRAFAVALVFGSAGWAFTSLHWLLYFDAWVVLALLGVAFGRGWLLLATAVTLGVLVDERLMVGLGMALMVRRWAVAVECGEAGERRWRQEVCLAGVLCVAYLLVRAALPSEGGLTWTQLIRMHAVGHAGPALILEGAYQGLRVGWLFVGYAVWWMWRQSGWDKWVGLCGFAATIFLSVFPNFDYSRGPMVLAPMVLWGGVLAARELSWLTPARAVLMGVVALALPAKHVVALYQVPIRSLAAEIERIHNPPEDLTADARLRESVAAVNRGDFFFARRHATVAILLEPDRADAYVVRSQISLMTNDPRGALADAASAHRLAPENPDIKQLLEEARKRAAGQD